MSRARNQSKLPTTGEMLDAFATIPIAFVVGTTVLPGFLLCVPALILAAALIVIPLVAVAVVLALAAAVLATPALLVRSIRALLARRAARTREPISKPGNVTVPSRPRQRIVIGRHQGEVS